MPSGDREVKLFVLIMATTQNYLMDKHLLAENKLIYLNMQVILFNNVQQLTHL